VAALNVFDITTYGAAGNRRGNDAPAIQAAIDAASAGGGGIVWIPSGHFRLASGVSTRGQVVLAGVGWETGGNNGSWLHVDDVGFVPLSLAGRGCIMRDIAIAHDQPVPSSEEDWAPYNYPYAIEVKADDILLQNLLLLNPTRGISIAAAPDASIGRVTLNRIWGQPLREGIRIDNAMDVVKIDNIHFWPFWSPDVIPSTRKNATAIRSFRNDNPHFTNVFALGYHVGFEFASSAGGVATGCTSRFLMANTGLDGTGEDGVRVTGDNTTGAIANFYNMGDSGNTGILVSARNVRLQCSNIRLSELRANGIRVDGAGNFILVSTLWIENWNTSGKGFPAVEVALGNAAYVPRESLFLDGKGAPKTGGRGTVPRF
jgi:hypothetical protein